MPRPRRLSDAQLLDAAARAIVARGDGAWALSDVAQLSGMSPAALVKRFGSKVGLLRAVAGRWADAVPEYEPDPARDPRRRIVAWARSWARDLGEAATARGHLMLLVEEIFDDEARAEVARGRQRQVAYLAAALEDAWRRDLLVVRPDPDVPDLWLDLLNGAALRGAFGDPAGALRRAVRHIARELDGWSV